MKFQSGRGNPVAFFFDNFPPTLQHDGMIPLHRKTLWTSSLLLTLASPGRADDPPASLAAFFRVPAAFAQQTSPGESPLVFANGQPVTSPEQWPQRRAELLKRWQDLLGEWPPLIEHPSVELLDSTAREGITQERIRFLWTPREKTEGYLLIPPTPGPHPAVLTVYYEPETAAGLQGENRDFAWQLARRGFVALSIGTKEASLAKTYSLYWPDPDAVTVQPLSMLACAAANAWHVLAERPEVDSKRIGIVGHSFGGKWAMFASCLFDRFACAVWSDPGIAFDDTRPSINYWEPWYLGWHPQPWRPRGLVTAEHPALGLYPTLRKQGRDLHELHALMAPRPFLVSGGSEDPPERWKVLNHTIGVNRLLGYENRVAMSNRPNHAPTPESNAVIYDFFSWVLKP